jgi:hypothetical protein
VMVPRSCASNRALHKAAIENTSFLELTIDSWDL